MAKQPTIVTVTTGNYSADTLNTNFTNIQSHFDFLISRIGDAPNTMGGDLDMDSNDIINVGAMDVATLTINGVEVTNVISNPLNGLTPTLGDLIYWDGSAWTLLSVGTDGQVLKLNAGVPTWGTDLDTDTDTVGITVEEDNVSIQTNVTVLNFVTGLQATTPIVTVNGSNEVTVDLDTFVNG